MISLLSGKKPRDKYILYAVSLIFLIIISYIDFLSGMISLSLLYVFPVAAVSWLEGKWKGAAGVLLVSLLESFVNYNIAVQSNWGVEIWNFFGRFFFYFTISFLVSYIKKILDAEAASARKDFLTSVNNSRSFYELAERELDRSRRNKKPLTIVYVDLDNFKSVNDLRGHLEGDRLLKIVAQTMQSNTRSVDVVARMGGDEFALLYPDNDYKQSHFVIKRIQGILLDAMRANNFPVTFSIGAVTFVSAPEALNAMIRKADETMYLVKNSGKNNVKHITI